MKKIAFIFVGILLLQAPAFSAQRGTPEYEKLKEYKKTQREKNAQPAAPGEKSFWQKEAERSGLAGTAAMFGNAAAGVLPGDKPGARE